MTKAEVAKRWYDKNKGYYAEMNHPHVDHNHRTGEVRGLLCRDCNLILGHADDSPEVLRRAAKYVEAK